MLYISFKPHLQCENVLNLSDWLFYNSYLCLLPFFLPQKIAIPMCDLLFERGYEDAKQHKDILTTKFKTLGIL
jgi:hypothetical protein